MKRLLMLALNQWMKMRTKKQIAKRYLRYLNTNKNTTIDIDSSIDSKEKVEEVINLLKKDLYETEIIDGQRCSTVRAWYLFCDIVVYKDIATGQLVWNSFVKKQFEMIERHAKAAYMAPRGHGKSFVAFCMYPIFKNYLIEGFEAMLISNIPRMVKDNFRVLKRIIDNNQMLLEFKDESNKKDLVWSQDRIEYHGGIISGFSIGTPPIGAHLNYVAVDDPLRHDKKYPDEYYINYVDAQILPTLKRKKGRFVLVGTPQHEEDLIHQCMWDKNNQIIIDGRKSIKGFYSWRFQAYDPTSKTPEDTLLVPEAFTYEEFEELKITMGEYRFNREYLCICQVNKNALINRKMWRNALDENLKLIQRGEEGKIYVIFVDSATSDAPTADYSAFMVMEYDESNKKKIIRHIWHGKGVLVDDQVRELKRLHHTFNNATIYVEKNNAGIAIIQGLVRENVMVMEHYTNPATKPKLVQDLISDFGSGMIVIPGDTEDFFTTKHIEKLKHECLNYGVKKTNNGESFQALAGHDDLVDSLWGAAFYCTANLVAEPAVVCGNYAAFD